MQITLASPLSTTVRGSVKLRIALVSLFTLCGALIRLGAVWDVQWHVVVGRDSFWIPPHALIYTSVACCGLIAAVYVLRYGLLRQAEAGPWPWGMLVGGLGVITMLLAAPFDNLWHQWYGIDVTIWSPPHMLGVLGAWIIAWGALWAWSQELAADASQPWSYLGLVVSGALLLAHANFGLIPAIRWASPKPFSPFLYPLLASIVLPAVVVALLHLSGRTWVLLTVLAALAVLRLVEQGVLATGYRTVITLWGERLRGRPEPIYLNYNLGLALACGLLLGMSLLVRLWPAAVRSRSWRSDLLLGAAAGLLLWGTTLLVHATWTPIYSRDSVDEWYAEAWRIVTLFHGAGIWVALLCVLIFGACGGLLAGSIIRTTSRPHPAPLTGLPR